MIVCLSGPSGVGKTTVAERLRLRTGLPLRSCGTAIRERAAAVGTPLDLLRDEEHERVDRETVAWAAALGSCIVEGRFLNQVFSGTGHPWLLFEVDADLQVRADRIGARQGSTFIAAQVRLVDEGDARFRTRLYAGRARAEPRLRIDGSRLSVEEVSDCIENALRETREAS